MSDEITVTKDSGHGKGWLKSEKARLAGAVGVGAAATIGAALLVDAFTDDRLGKKSGKWAGGEVKIERKVFRAFRDARLAREKADKAFRRARKANSYQKAQKALEEGRRHWKRYLSAMAELDEQLSLFESKSSVIAKAANVKSYGNGGRASKVKASKAHPARSAAQDKKDAKKFDRRVLKEFHKMNAELLLLQQELAKAQVNIAAAEAVAAVAPPAPVQAPTPATQKKAPHQGSKSA